MSHRQQKGSEGFTLIELMVTIAILAIVIGVAIPSFTSQIRNNRSAALAEELATALNYARSEAVKRSGLVSLCASGDGATCSNDWTEGWMVFVDGASSETGALNVSTVLRVWEGPGANGSISVKQDSSTTNFVRYSQMGALARSGSVEMDAKVNDCTGDASRRIRITKGGTPSVSTQSCS